MAPKKAGFCLIELMVAVAIIGILAMVIASMTTSAFKATKSSKIRLDIQDIKRKITKSLSCQNTFATYGAARPIPCPSGTVIAMKNSAGGNLVPPSEKIADWNIDARCEVLGGVNGLSIYATKKKPGGGYFKDPLNEFMLLDESSPVSLIFDAAARPCESFFSSTSVAVACPAGSIVTGVNFEADSFNCTPIGNVLPGCGGGTVLTNVGGVVQCVPITNMLPVCGAGTVLKNVGGAVQCLKNGLDMTDCLNVSNGGGPPSYYSYAQCPANYRIVGGQSRCTGVGAQGFTHSSGINGNGWSVDCWRGDLGGESSTEAVATCCRYYD